VSSFRRRVLRPIRWIRGPRHLQDILARRCSISAAQCRISKPICGCAVLLYSWRCVHIVTCLISRLVQFAILKPTCFDASNTTMQLPSTLLALLFTFLTPISAVDADVPTSNESLLWGPYRPNVYLGLRPRVPNSLVAGLMWGKLEDVGKSR
jgi:hypothetical protein